MRWTVHGERALYRSEWVDLSLVDVEVPGLRRFEHHVVRTTPAVGTVVDVDGRVLLLWRHRFITDTWGWEIPAGRIERGETVDDAARRETIEETGWEPTELSPLTVYAPANGLADTRFHLLRATAARRVGEPTDPAESERIEWVPWLQVRDEIAAQRVHDGLSLTALLWCLALVGVSR